MRCSLIVFMILFLFLAMFADAHFGAILPSDDIVSPGDSRTLHLSICFFHPFEGQYMPMERPQRFGVVVRGKREELLPQLKQEQVEGGSIWQMDYPIRRPGDHVFYLEPTPYFEPAEECFIEHDTKLIVNAMGMEVGWDEPVGLKTEIIPLTRPYGLWTGNLFRGVVLLYGEPAPGTEVEIEYLNTDGIRAPADPFVTQVVKTDSNGVFSYAIPRAGWWGFAALSVDRQKRRHTDGKEYEVELGAVLWVRTVDME